MILPALFFYLFAGICVASAVMVIVSRNPVHSVLFLILAFVNASTATVSTSSANTWPTISPRKIENATRLILKRRSVLRCW